MAQTVFMTQENVGLYKKIVLEWLRLDFIEKGFPEHHFWHNQSTVVEAFDKHCAMIVLSDDNEVMGYMVWSLNTRHKQVIHIDIVEVAATYRRQGICKRMLHDFAHQFPKVIVLTASVIQESQGIFTAMGWESAPGLNREKYFFKTLTPTLQPLDKLPNGPAIALFSKSDAFFAKLRVDDYTFWKDPEKYPQYPLKYFSVRVDEHGKLQIPIVWPFHYDGYIGVYMNKTRFTEGKVKYLLANTVRPLSSILILDRIQPRTLAPFRQVKFFEQPTAMPSETISSEALTQGGGACEKRKISSASTSVLFKPASSAMKTNEEKVRVDEGQEKEYRKSHKKSRVAEGGPALFKSAALAEVEGCPEGPDKLGLG